LEFMDFTAFDPYLLRLGLHLIKRLIKIFFITAMLCKLTLLLDSSMLFCPIRAFYWTVERSLAVCFIPCTHK
jgi:hypothetical protein